MAEEKPQSKPDAKPDTKPEGKPEGKPRKRDKEVADTKGKVVFSSAFESRVEEIIGRTGTRGEATQVRVKVLDGRDKNKTIRRNVRGPIQLGDTVMLRETEIEARPLNKAGRGNN
ncbi:MAG: 30S ribosomal protein S28e [Nanoarchaeota archaeon]|nr:30S ribosomal protein S28e [Nanoarchaeota archaeon]